MKGLKFFKIFSKIFFIFIISCVPKYTKTGKMEQISEKIENVHYTVNEISQPTPQNPYLLLKVKAEGTKIKITNEEFMVKEEVPLFLPILTTGLGLTTGLLLGSQGYVVFGRDIAILSFGASLGMFAYNNFQKQKPWQTIWKEDTTITAGYKFVPTEPFTVKLQGSEYSTSIIPDKDGILRVNLLEFAPFYREGSPFYLTLFSPENKNLGEFKITTNLIAESLKRAKTLKYPPSLSFNVFFDDSTGDRNFLLDAEEEGRITLFIKNTGRGIARDLEVKITLAKEIPGLNIPRSTKIDSIEVMKEKKVVIPIKATREIPTAQVEAKIEVLEPYFQADAEPKILKFETRKFEPPELIVYDKAVEEGRVLPGKSANISLIIQNYGKGRAEDVKAEIRVPQGVTYLGDTTIFVFGKMEPGEWKKIDFPIFVGARFREESLKINLKLKEKREEFSKSLVVSFPLNIPVKKPKEIVIRGEERTLPVSPPPRLTSDVDINIPETQMKNPDAIAVIIVNKFYEERGVPDVEYADNDGRILKEYLIKTLGYKEENIIFVENAKKSDFERIFGTEGKPEGQLYNYVKPNKSDVFIYYTGHGAPDIKTRSAYFVPVDCDPNYVELNGYPLETFYKNLMHIPAKSTLVVIDACFSGGSERGMLIAMASPITVAPVPVQLPGEINVFTSSKEDEISSWYPEQRHSLFTYYFLKALRGECDKNEDGIITLGEIKEYCVENVSYWARRLYNRPQTPTFKGNENMILLKLR